MSSNDRRLTPKIKGGRDIRQYSWAILLGTIYLFVLLLNGLDEFIRSGFDLDFMFTPEWGYKVFRVLLSNILVFLGTFLYLVMKAMNEREEIIKKRKQVDEYADKHIDPVTFDPFFINFEQKRKIKYYKRDMETQLEKLENKAKIEDIELWDRAYKNMDENGEIIDKHLNKEFAKNKFCQRKRKMLRQLEPEFIEKHVPYMDIPYGAISKSFVTNGYNKPFTKHDEYYVETNSKKLFRDLGPKFMIMAGWLIAGESLVLDFVMADSLAIAMFNMMIKILPLLAQIYFAFSYCESYIKEKILVDFKKRLDIITLYLSHIKQNKEGVVTNAQQER